MSFKLLIENLLNKTENGIAEQAYEREVVRIGRKDSNEVQLGARTVSGLHAEIRQKTDRFFLVDMKSKNGTRLNGEMLTAEIEYPLGPEDQIIIGEFILRFFPIQREEEKPEPVAEASDVTIGFSGGAEEIETLLSELRQTYADHAEGDPEERRSAIAGILRKGVSHLDEARAKRLLDLVEARFPEPDYQQERIKQTPLNAATPFQSKEAAASRAAYEGLKKFAGNYFEGADILSTPEEAAAFVDRVDRVLAIMINALSDAVRGRREFEMGIEVESTRIFLRNPNPIKVVEGSKEIGKYLFNLKISEATEKVVADLEDVFTDLALHQVGMIAGFKGSLRGLLKELDPDFMEEQARSEGGFRRFGPWRRLSAWNLFRDKHRELSEEEVRTFEQILGPYFAEGYLSIQKKKRPS
jgi:type VI secretion system FHA domain protein